MMRILEMLGCFLIALLFIVIILGISGSGEYADAKALEKTLCERQPQPGWCSDVSP